MKNIENKTRIVYYQKGQAKSLSFLYTTKLGGTCLKFLVKPYVSKISGRFSFSQSANCFTLSLCLFIWALFKGFTTDFTVIYDTTVYVTAITISGGIFGVCLKAYMSKSKAENIYKVQKGMYENIMQIKLQYNESMMQLAQKYHMTQDDVDMIDNISPINDGVDSIINDMKENIER